MDLITKLQALRIKALEDAEAVIAKAKTDKGEDRELTEDEAKQVDGFQAEVKRLDGEIAKASKDAERKAWAAQMRAEMEKSTGRKTAPDALPGANGDKPATDGQPKIEIKGMRRTGALKNFKGVIAGKSADERAYRFGQWVLASLTKQLPNRFHFPDAVKFCEEYIAKLHQTNVNTTGGYSVPEEFGTDLIDLRETYGVARRLLKNRPMDSDTRTDPRRAGGLTAYAVGEGAAGTESTKAWDQVRLTAKDWMVISRYTAQLSADSVINIGDDLAGEIAYAFSNKEDDCAFNGTGTGTYHGIVGIRSQLESVNGVDDGGGLVLGAGNAWSELTLANFNTVVGRLPQYADTPNTAWLCHRAFYFGVMEKLALAAGGVAAREVREGGRGRPIFLGYPVEISQVMPSSEANSQICAILGDYSLAGSFGDRQQDAIAFSEHASVGGESVFERNEIAIRGTSRWDINIHDVGTSSAAGPVVGLITASA